MSKPILVVICAVPGSGKSYLCGQSQEDIFLHGKKEDNHDTYNSFGFVVHSSDDMRIILSKREGSELDKANDQSISGEVFEKLHQDIIKDLKNGKNVVLDATNISHRASLINKIRKNVDCTIIAHQITTPLSISLKRNKERERVVPVDVIKNMYKRLMSNPPTYSEGFDKVYKTQNLYLNEQPLDKNFTSKNKLIEVLINNPDNIKETDFLDFFPEVEKCAQNNPHHCFDLLHHTLEVVKNVDTPELKVAALLHDIGKVDTKTIDERTGYDRFFDHAYYSACAAQGYLSTHGFNKKEMDDILFLVKYHDIFMNVSKKMASKKEIESDKDFFTSVVAAFAVPAVYDIDLNKIITDYAKEKRIKNFGYFDCQNAAIMYVLGKKYINTFIDTNYPKANETQKQKLANFMNELIDHINSQIKDKNIDIEKKKEQFKDLMQIAKADVIGQADVTLDQEGNIVTTKEEKLQKTIEVEEVVNDAIDYLQENLIQTKINLNYTEER